MTPRKPLRLWPGVVFVIAQWLLWFVVPVVAPDAVLIGSIGGLGATLPIVVWWMFFSRAQWSERVGAIVLMVVAVMATRPLLHRSIQSGLMGRMFFIYVVPGLCLALVAGAAAGRRLSVGPRRAVMAAMILLACAAWTLLRTDGILVGRSQIAWRWTPTAEERLLARAASEPLDASTSSAGSTLTAPAPAAPVAVPAVPAPAKTSETTPTVAAPGGPTTSERGAKRVEWSGFRGPDRDGIVHGVRIETDWAASPPVEMWRRPIGPGWSSIAVQGDFLYTQEQRGDAEIVACYRVSTGKPVWMHRDATRFWESNGGAGPRGTPTLGNGRVYAFGATGILNVLDAASGAVVWSRNVASDTGRKTPEWGFASSPLVVDTMVIVAASGTLAAYDLATGKPRWTGPQHGGTYSSPHLVSIGGVPQILLLSAPGAISVAPADGALLWEHTWDGGAIVQPAMTADGDVLINAIGGMGGYGVRRLNVTRNQGQPPGWTVTERWTSIGLKPYFNDFVVHKGHAFGFDGSILACIDLADGKRKWKGGRYGEGQLLLLADQDVLLVMSEEGELALVSATTDKFTELARFKAIEGKTWNHPVLAGDVLLVRNGEEMAAFRLALAGR